MQRAAPMPTANWSERVQSELIAEQMDACRDRLYDCDDRSVFDDLSPLETEGLFFRSYYASEGKRMGLEALRESVLADLDGEIRCLSFGEDALVKRMLMANGEVELDDEDQLPYAESLIRRLLCTIVFDDDDVAYLRLCPDLMDRVSDAMLHTDPLLRELLFRVEAMVHSMIYLYGFVYADSLADQIVQELVSRKMAVSRRAMLRFLKASFLYMEGPRGQLFLPHPGLWDPERILDERGWFEAKTWNVSFEMMLGGMNGILTEERAANTCLADALKNAIRPEENLGETMTDLRIMAKQGASFQDLETVLKDRICIAPNARILSALERLRMEAVPWTGNVKAVVN